MSEIKVTEAVIEDATQISEIAYSVARIHYKQTQKEFKKPTLKTQADYVRQCISDDDILILKAKIQDEIVGYVVVYFNTFPDKYFQFNKRAFIGSMGVDKNHHRQGVGKALLTAVEIEVKKRHISVVEVDYYTFNRAAERLYKTAGYTENKRYMRKFI